MTRWLCCVVALTALATSAAFAQSEVAPLPPPGSLVDVGGWHLHLHCTGESRADQPTVVLEAGKGDFSVEWSLVQPGISQYARVCSYDRAGDGWSELGPHPRTFRQIVYELHTLLEKAGERAPFILVGHSYGAWLVRAYQATYTEDVAGLVLVESGANDPWRLMPDGQLVRASQLTTGRSIPGVKTGGPLRIADIPPAALTQMSAGLAAASRNANEPPRDKLPEGAQRMRTWALGQLGHVAAAVNPFEYDELAVLATAAQSVFPLGDLPLLVITRGLQDEQGPEAERLENEHQQDQKTLVALSQRGEHLIASRSGHHVPLDEPELVVHAVQKLVGSVRDW